jgi:hypothetical protein
MQAIEGLEKRGLAGVVWLVAFALTNFPVLHVLREHGDLLARPALRNAIPAVPLVGCLTLLVLLMGLCLRLPLGDAESPGEASAI